jgi:hypothetical protein
MRYSTGVDIQRPLRSFTRADAPDRLEADASRLVKIFSALLKSAARRLPYVVVDKASHLIPSRSLDRSVANRLIAI